MASCGGVARDNGTYFVNPNHPDAYDSTGSCQLSIQKIHPDICQMRLDFDNLVIAQPEPLNHICNTDQFLVSGGSPVPTICGTSTGDHSKSRGIFGTYTDFSHKLRHPNTTNSVHRYGCWPEQSHHCDRYHQWHGHSAHVAHPHNANSMRQHRESGSGLPAVPQRCVRSRAQFQL